MSIYVRVFSCTATLVNAFSLTIANAHTIAVGTGIKRRTVHCNGQVGNVPKNAKTGRGVDNGMFE